MITEFPSVDGMSLIVEIQDGELIYTGHAFQATIEHEQVPAYLSGKYSVDDGAGWKMSLIGHGNFVVREAEEKKPRSLLVTYYSMDYVQGLEERVAQLESQLREHKDG